LKEPHLVQLFNRFATYNGSSPYKTPGMMTLVQHLEQEYGTYVSDKGMNNITKSLYDLALRQGIDFKFNSFVSQILSQVKELLVFLLEKNLIAVILLFLIWILFRLTGIY